MTDFRRVVRIVSVVVNTAVEVGWSLSFLLFSKVDRCDGLEKLVVDCDA